MRRNPPKLEKLLADEKWHDDPFYDLLVQAEVKIPGITIIRKTPNERIMGFQERVEFERRLEVCVRAYIRRYGGINSLHIKLAAAYKYMADNPGEGIDSSIEFSIFQYDMNQFNRDIMTSQQTPQMTFSPP